jgi:hypothetical protein
MEHTVTATPTRKRRRQMRSVPRLLLLALLVAGLTVPAAAQASAAGSARRAARHAANHYASASFGVGGRASDWSARCARRGAGWKCRVNFKHGACGGSLRLTSRLHAYAYRMACLA